MDLENLGNFYLVEQAHLKVRKILSHFDTEVKVLIGGGAVRDLAFDLGKPKDFDIYLIPEGVPEDIPTFLKDIRDHLEVQMPITENVISDGDLKKFKHLSGEASNDVTVKFMDSHFEKGGIPFQFLYKNHSRNPQDLVECFDLDICQFGYDGKKFYIGKDVDIDRVEKALFHKGPVTLMKPSSTYSRLKKFRDRYGCDIKEASYALHRAWSCYDHDDFSFIGTPKDESQRFYWKSPQSVLD